MHRLDLALYTTVHDAGEREPPLPKEAPAFHNLGRSAPVNFSNNLPTLRFLPPGALAPKLQLETLEPGVLQGACNGANLLSTSCAYP